MSFIVFYFTRKIFQTNLVIFYIYNLKESHVTKIIIIVPSEIK